MKLLTRIINEKIDSTANIFDPFKSGSKWLLVTNVHLNAIKLSFDAK